ncbi:patatin-domain-containing protein [Neoconidiobolus thromboides FSU 785]|nr:patatin-domain-containing protein [Neoconidiobolus thromboides FSU 785]
MDQSNPELYAYLLSFIENGKEGIESFKKAMKIKSSANLISTPSSPHLSSFTSINDFNFDKREDSRRDSNGRRSSFQFDENQSYFGLVSTMLTSSSHTNKSEGLGYSLLRFPFLIFVGTMICIELFFYAMVRQVVALWEYLYVWTGELKQLKQKLRKACSYEEWKEIGLKLDELMGKEEWRKEAKMAYYDHELIINLNNKMKKLRERKKVNELKDILLQGGLKSNVGNIENNHLYSKTYFGTKKIVEDFYSEVVEALDFIGSSKELSLAEKKSFFEQAFQSYGRSALCLSGGATLAYFHFGVVRTLIENNMLPKIITGTSAGSMIAAMTACRTDEELKEIFKPETHVLINPCSEPMSVKITRLLKTGALFSATNFATDALWVTLGHTTFLEAYKRTGKILNVTAVPYDSYSPAKLFNYVSTPDVVIWSAVIASSAIPGVLNPITLMVKKPDGTLEPYLNSGVKWRDGSLKTDIPLDALKSFFNVNYSIVSQVNPHISIFYYNHRGSVGHPAANRYGKGWRGGFLASSLEHFLKLDLKKWLRVIRDLELLPHFMQQDWSYVWLQKFDGNVTILPRVNILDYINIFNDPDYQRLKEHLENGANKTWPIIHMVDNRTKIEKKIFSWLHELYENKSTENGVDHGNNNKTNNEPDLPKNSAIQPNGGMNSDSTFEGKVKFDLPTSNRTPLEYIDHLLDQFDNGKETGGNNSAEEEEKDENEDKEENEVEKEIKENGDGKINGNHEMENK